MMQYHDKQGNIVEPPEGIKPFFRPAIYGLLEKDGKILCQEPSWDPGKLCLPGGGMDILEDFDTAMKREFLEETGYHIELENPQPMFVMTKLFANPKKDLYWQRLNFYFRVKDTGIEPEKDLDPETLKLIWKDKSDLKPEDFTYFMHDFIRELLKQ